MNELLTCKRCGNSWKPKKAGRPAQCPHCHSSYWDKDYARSDLVLRTRHQGVGEQREVYRERALAYSRKHSAEYYGAHRDERLAYSRTWSKANSDKVLEYSRRRRARLAGAEGSFEEEDFKELCRDIFEHLCPYCGRVRKLTPDHMTPISRGGSDYIDNIIPACRSCNSSKGVKTIEEFLGLRVLEEALVV